MVVDWLGASPTWGQLILAWALMIVGITLLTSAITAGVKAALRR